MTEQEKHSQQIQLLKQMHRKRMCLFGAVILVAGIFIGSAATAIFNTAKKTTQKPSGIEFVNDRMIHHLRKQLDLTPEQSDQIKAIYTEHLTAINDVRKQAKPQIAEQMNLLNEEVLEVLSDQQKEKWNENINRLRKQFDPGKGRYPRGPMAPGSGRGDRDGQGRRGGGYGPGPGGQRPFDFWQQHERQGSGPGP